MFFTNIYNNFSNAPNALVADKAKFIEEIDAAVEDTQEVVASFGISLPRKLAGALKHIASSLDEGLTGVATAIEQITAATNPRIFTRKSENRKSY